MRRLPIVILLLLSASELAAGDEPFKVVLERKGESAVEVRLVDVHDQTVKAPPGTTFMVNAANGRVSCPTDQSGNPSHVITGRSFDKGAPLFDFTSDNLWWPSDIAISATVMVPNRPPIPTEVLKVPVRPYLAGRLNSTAPRSANPRRTCCRATAFVRRFVTKCARCCTTPTM